MTNKLDYKKLGLKCGIEIHQRIAGNKLFCSCPGILRDDKPDIIIQREMRAVAGETGKIDKAAKHEMHKDEYYIYEAYSDTTCLVELDEEPPHPLNKNALDTTLQVSKMLNAEIVDEVQVMRKTVVNGSNTSGFQRTALVAINGTMEIPTNDTNNTNKKIGIQTIAIEEDAAKDISKGVDSDGRRYVTYRLDRLGTPLIEIATDPDMNTPEECKEVAATIGMILRSTGKAARGLGTIRQDVNVSIINGNRVEIKGAQDLKMIPTLVEYEALRQIAILELKKELTDKKVDILNLQSADVSNILSKTECKFVNNAITSGNIALAFKLTNCAGLLGKEVQPNKRVGSEMSDYAKVKTGIGGIIHSDEKLDKYKFSETEIKDVRNTLKCSENDAFGIIVASKETAERAIKFALERISQFTMGVPNEVRKANQDGTTTFMRPMPGAARMYPETDIKPITVDTTNIELPELLSEKKERFKKEYGMAEDMARDLSKSILCPFFENAVKEYDNVKPAFIVELLLSLPKNIRRKYKVETDFINETTYKEILNKLNENKLTKESIEEILLKICKGEKIEYSKYEPLSDKEIETSIKKILAENEGINFKIIIGKVMGKLKGKADGKKIMEMLKKLQK